MPYICILANFLVSRCAPFVFFLPQQVPVAGAGVQPRGKRLNTREYRTRKKLEEQRHVLIQEAMLINPEYKPPADYK